MNEVLLDQIPSLIDLQRYLEQLSIMEPPAMKKDIILEQVNDRCLSKSLKRLSGADLGGGGMWNEPPKLEKKMRHYNTLTWLQNAGNSISKDLQLDHREPLQGTTFSGLYLESPSLPWVVFFDELPKLLFFLSKFLQ